MDDCFCRVSLLDRKENWVGKETNVREFYKKKLATTIEMYFEDLKRNDHNVKIIQCREYYLLSYISDDDERKSYELDLMTSSINDSTKANV